jgi:hypothetical protein
MPNQELYLEYMHGIFLRGDVRDLLHLTGNDNPVEYEIEGDTLNGYT